MPLYDLHGIRHDLLVCELLMKTYTELCQYATFEDRFHYLQLHGTVGYDTFGFDRWLNQNFYQSREWRQFRDRIIVRDAGCDLACKDHEITDWVIRNGKPIRPRIIIHHLNPLTKEDVLQHNGRTAGPGKRDLRERPYPQGHPLWR